MAELVTLSRRNMLKSAAGLVIGLHLVLPGARALAQGAAQPPSDPNAFVHIGLDDSVTVLIKHIEFGQGPFTGLATLVAEELDADWSQMRAQHAPADDRIYANLKLGLQLTGGSTAIANSYEQMRRVGASARAMLVTAAAEAWQVSARDIRVDKGIIAHPASGRSARFGAFAEAAGRLPIPPDVALKDPATFRLIGREARLPKLDTVAKSTGKAVYTLDLDAPDMLTVVIARPDRFGARMISFDATESMKVGGVVAVHAVPSGVAIYGRGMWPALKGRERLRVDWNYDKAEARSSDQIIADFHALTAQQGIPVSAQGDVEAALAGSGMVLEAEFVVPYLAHAPMEPLDGYLEWTGEAAVARMGCQAPAIDQRAIAGILGIVADKVSVETMMAGGSFGRRGTGDAHFAKELAHVARAIGPGHTVKLVWTREDDIRGGYYRPLTVHRLRGAVKDGRIAAVHSRIVSQSIAKGTAFEPMMMRNGFDYTAAEGANELLYELPAHGCDVHHPQSPISVSFWRSVGNSHTGFAVESFIDQLLVAAGADPVAGRLAMLDASSRAAGVLKKVAELAAWTGPKTEAGRGRGVALVKSFNSYVAQIAEVSIRDSGEPRVHKIWCAVDCGIVVNPDIVRAQIEGGIGFALGHALFGEIVIANGAAQTSNFADYRSLRIDEMPEIAVAIIPSTQPPTGIGEPGVPPVAPAVANAIAALGLPRPTRLPLVRA